MLQGHGGSSIYSTQPGLTPGKGNMGQDSLHTCTLHGIVHGIRFTTWFAVHIYRLTHTQSLFFFLHKDLLLHKVEKDDGKKTSSSAPTIASQIPLFEHLCPPAASSSRTPERPGPASGAASAAASRPRLRTGCLSPSFLGPAHLIRFC